MNKKITVLHVLVLLASSCYVCQSFAMDRAATEAGDREKVLTTMQLLMQLVEQQNEVKIECAVAGERKERMSAFDKLSSEVFGGFSSLETRGKAELARMSEAHERFAAALAALTSRVDTHDKFATDLASLTSKVATHDNLVGTLALLKSEVDGLSGSVASRFAESETREKTELASMSKAHAEVAKALAALTGKVDSIHSCVSNHLIAIDSRLMESEKSGKILDASLAEFKGRANPLLDDFARRMGLVENLASATNVAYYEFKDKKLNPLLTALDASLAEFKGRTNSSLDELVRRMGLVESLASATNVAYYEFKDKKLNPLLDDLARRMGTFASQADLGATQVSLNAVESRRIAMESRLAAVEGSSSKTSGLEARMNALEARMVAREKDAEFMAAAHCGLRGPGFYSHGDVPYCGNASGGLLVDRFTSLDSRLRAVEGASSGSAGLASRLTTAEGRLARVIGHLSSSRLIRSNLEG